MWVSQHPGTTVLLTLILLAAWAAIWGVLRAAANADRRMRLAWEADEAARRQSRRLAEAHRAAQSVKESLRESDEAASGVITSPYGGQTGGA